MLSHILPSIKQEKSGKIIEKHEKQRIHLENCLILGKLIIHHPDVLQ